MDLESRAVFTGSAAEDMGGDGGHRWRLQRRTARSFGCEITVSDMTKKWAISIAQAGRCAILMRVSGEAVLGLAGIKNPGGLGVSKASVSMCLRRGFVRVCDCKVTVGLHLT